MLLALLLLLLMCRAAEEWLNMFCSCGVCPTCDKCAAVTYIENALLKLPSFMGMPRFAACFGAWWWKLGLKSSGYPLFFFSNRIAAIHLSPYLRPHSVTPPQMKMEKHRSNSVGSISIKYLQS